jgi:hypothetical protein
MSIFSQLLEGKISLATAVSEAESWFAHLEGTSPVAASIGAAASAAANVAGTVIGNALTASTAAIEGWANAGITSVLGTQATQLTPAVDNALNTWEQTAVAAIQSEVAAFRAKLTPMPPATGGATTAAVS